jgi:hypothetical protein
VIDQDRNPTPQGFVSPFDHDLQLPLQPVAVPSAATHQTQTAAVGDRGRERPASRSAHRCQRDRMDDS